MDWSKTKTIFITVFLILDIFLLAVFLNKHSASQFEFIKEASIEDKLKSYNIEYGKLPEEVSEETILTAKTKSFTKKEVSLLQNQTVKFPDNQTVLESHLQKPIKLGEKKLEDLKAFVETEVIFGDQYQYWELDSEKNTAIFYQHYKDKKLFEIKNGRLEVQLNSNNEIIGYKQTMLEDLKENGQEESIISAHQAIQTLYKNGLIKPNSKISDVELGYYTFVHLTELQVLTPTWYFKIKNGEKTEKMFVNAFDGSIYKNEENS
ncbi:MULTISPECIES: two-component system regulatory protein YycI [Bacillaceae]|uniref:two-component system regulatory protein YycI n=1 Tax=Bacillaceae TaxID=186817 RepID=UPI0016032A5D|nr:two-component system regulatory protein YycI [Bacillus sp. PK3_68]